MRTLIAVALSTTLIASAAFAADSASPLAAGKPAGVKHAQEVGQTGWILIGVVAVAAIAAGVASSSNGSPTGPQQNIIVTTTTT